MSAADILATIRTEEIATQMGLESYIILRNRALEAVRIQADNPALQPADLYEYLQDKNFAPENPDILLFRAFTAHGDFRHLLSDGLRELDDASGQHLALDDRIQQDSIAARFFSMRANETPPLQVAYAQAEEIFTAIQAGDRAALDFLPASEQRVTAGELLGSPSQGGRPAIDPVTTGSITPTPSPVPSTETGASHPDSLGEIVRDAILKGMVDPGTYSRMGEVISEKFNHVFHPDAYNENSAVQASFERPVERVANDEAELDGLNKVLVDFWNDTVLPWRESLQQPHTPPPEAYNDDTVLTTLNQPLRPTGSGCDI